MTCPYCHLYPANACEVCAVAPLTRSGKPQKRKSRAKVSTGIQAAKAPKMPHIDVSGFPDDHLYVMLLDGRLYEMVGYGKTYLAIVDRLLKKAYPVAMYRFRVVSGKST